MDASDSDQHSPRTLALIRAALLIGVLFFGAIAWFLTRTGGLAALDPPVLAQFRLILAIGFVAVAIGLFVLRRHWQKKDTFRGKAIYNIIGWAVAEAAALAGGTYFMVTGNALYYLLGLALMVIAGFMLLPVPSRSRQ